MHENNNYSKVFLSAEWKYLILANYLVDPEILIPFLPKGTELDSYHGNHFISLVAFRFLNTKLKGLPIPFHTDFEEINLRFYVKKESEEGWRRGVVFIKEIVPKTMIALVANNLYSENYIALKTKSEIKFKEGMPVNVKYFWKINNNWNYIATSVIGEKKKLKPGSYEEFISEHYWGYSKGKSNTTEYRVEHPKWSYWQVDNTKVEIDIDNLYGNKFKEALTSRPHSVFLAEGSDVTVSHGIRTSY